MKFNLPQYKNFRDELLAIAKRFSLNPDMLTVEFYSPRSQAILVEKVQNDNIKIHIDLQESRIVSIQQISPSVNGNFEFLKQKYRRFMG